MRKFLFILLFLFHHSYAEKKIPIIAPLDGVTSWGDTEMEADHYHDISEKERCFEARLERVYCVHNKYIELYYRPQQENECVLYVYDDILEVVAKSVKVKKGDTLGYAKTDYFARPSRIINGC